MDICEIDKTEVDKLSECISALSEYHNKVSVNFKGYYPKRAYSDTLESFSENLESGMSRIAVIESTEKVIGFCKIDILQSTGKLDYLMVLQEHRGNGYGKMLMNWAMGQFRESNISDIEVRVVDGNETIHFYEKYGFKMKSYVLGYRSVEK